jgi:hypothetical protein
MYRNVYKRIIACAWGDGEAEENEQGVDEMI